MLFSQGSVNGKIIFNGYKWHLSNFIIIKLPGNFDRIWHIPYMAFITVRQISLTSNYIVQCAWFQAACNPPSSHGCQCSAMLHFLVYTVKRQQTICFKSLKPIQIGLCILMSMRIHLLGLHLDAQYDQTWHLSTQLRSGERTDRRLLWLVNHTIVTDPTVRQPGFDLPRQSWSLMNHFQTGKGPCRANLHKWGLSQSPSCDCGQRQTTNQIVDVPIPLTKFEGGLTLLHEADDDAVIWQLQHSWNK